MLEALQVAQLDLSITERKQLKTKVRETTKKGPLESLLARLLSNTDPHGSYDPWGSQKEPRLEAFWRDEQNDWMVAHVESRVGPYPVPGIGNCRFEDAVRYAVGDADYTGRVAVRLAELRQGAFEIHHHDRD
jgi:hypothetical protein